MRVALDSNTAQKRNTGTGANARVEGGRARRHSILIVAATEVKNNNKASPWSVATPVKRRSSSACRARLARHHDKSHPRSRSCDAVASKLPRQHAWHSSRSSSHVHERWFTGSHMAGRTGSSSARCGRPPGMHDHRVTVRTARPAARCVELIGSRIDAQRRTTP